MKVPKSIWIIYDPLDGPHLFRTEERAKRTYKKWISESESCFDDVHDISKPIQYKISNKAINLDSASERCPR